jgi:hypothetical protein
VTVLAGSLFVLFAAGLLFGLCPMGRIAILAALLLFFPTLLLICS